MDNLENILESILFVSGDAVDISDITSKIDATKQDIKNAVKKLKNKYKEGSGIVLLEFNNKLQFASNGAYGEEVSKVLNPIRQRNLSRATLETASIIAYKQPVTRLEIEEIRGVSSDYAINILLEHNLIEIVGRKDTVGKPVLFGTTDEFLKRFNITSLDELPDYNELLERVKVIHSDDNRLYNHFEIQETDEEMEKKLGLSEDVAMANGDTPKSLDLDGELIGEKNDFEMLEGETEPENEKENQSNDFENNAEQNDENVSEDDEEDEDNDDDFDDEEDDEEEDNDDDFDDDEDDEEEDNDDDFDDDDDDWDDDDDGDDDWDIV